MIHPTRVAHRRRVRQRAWLSRWSRRERWLAYWRARFQSVIQERRSSSRLVTPPAPRYDDVYWNGVQFLNSL